MKVILTVLILAVAGSCCGATKKKPQADFGNNLEVGIYQNNVEVGMEGALPGFRVIHIVDDTHVIGAFNETTFCLTFPAKACGLVDGKYWGSSFNCKVTGTTKYAGSTIFTIEPKALAPPDPKPKKKPTKKQAEKDDQYRKTTALVLEILQKLPHGKK